MGSGASSAATLTLTTEAVAATNTTTAAAAAAAATGTDTATPAATTESVSADAPTLAPPPTTNVVDAWNKRIEAAVSHLSVAGLFGGMTMGFSEHERRENEKAERLQKSVGTFVVNHCFYGFPTAAKKQSADPLSPLWIEVDLAKLEEMIDAHNENETTTIVLDRKLLSTIPSGVLIDKAGNVKIVFAKSGLSYDLTSGDVEKAVAGARSSSRKLLMPSAPVCEYAGATTLVLRWDLPYPAGITNKAELQFVDAAKFTPKGAEPSKVALDNNHDGARDGFVTFTRKPKEGDWQYCAVRSYESHPIDTHEYDHLRPGKSFFFRLRLWTHEGYTQWSEPSKAISTLAGPPSQPLPPVVVVSMATCMQVRWTPSNANGSKVTAYVLRGKGAGDSEFSDLYHGPLLSHLVMNLHPDSAYSFQVAAMNSIGISEFSELGSGKTVAVKVTLSPESAVMRAALECREAWTECWDPQSEQYFFFNSITGTRQLERPMALRVRPAQVGSDGDGGDDDHGDGTKEVPEEVDEKKEKEVSFRKKRFRLVAAIHRISDQQKQKRHSRAQGSGPAGVGSPDRRGEVYQVELRRSHLLLDGFRAIHKASILQVYNRLKVEFKGEEGIDSGGLGKEAFLLLSKDATTFAGPAFKNWLVLYKAAEESAATASGGLFFTEEAPTEKEEETKAAGKKEHAPPPGGPRAMQAKLASARKSASKLLDLTAQQRQKSWRAVAPAGAVGSSSNMLSHGRQGSRHGSFSRPVDAAEGGEAHGGPTGSVAASLLALTKDEKVTREVFFRFLGRLVAKALYDRQLIDMPLAPILYKHMVGDVAEDDAPVAAEASLPGTPIAPGSKGSPVKGPPKGGPSPTPKPYGSPGVVPPPARKPAPVPAPPSPAVPSPAAPAKSNAPASSSAAAAPAATDEPPRLTDDDLADFPDELSDKARLCVKKRLLQALVDVRSLDGQLYKSLLWMVNNDITNVIDETFSVVSASTGETVPLCRDGEAHEVTEDNKLEYVELMARWKTTYAVAGSLQPFLKGFHELVPTKALKDAGISAEELSLILNGKADIDVEELRPYVIFQGDPYWGEQSEVVLWLWQALREFDDDGRRGFLKFFTGSSRIPLDGFDPALNFTQGVDKVVDSLPTAHTCFNQLVLPSYTSYEVMKSKILFAIANTEGFELS